MMVIGDVLFEIQQVNVLVRRVLVLKVTSGLMA